MGDIFSENPADIAQSPPDSIRAHAVSRKSLWFGITLICSLALIYFFSRLTLAYIYFARADHLSENGRFDHAVLMMEKAEKLNPYDPAFKKKTGDLHFNQGLTPLPPSRKIPAFQRAIHHYREAAYLNPLEPEFHFRIAKSQMQILELYQRQFSGIPESFYDPLPQFKKALELRPDNVWYLYEIIKYLRMIDNDDDLSRYTEQLMENHPENYYRLEANLPGLLENHMRDILNGLSAATKKPKQAYIAHKILSEIDARNNDWASARRHFKEYLALQTIDIGSADYLRMGYLHLKNQSSAAAVEFFRNGVFAAQDIPRTFKLIFSFFIETGFKTEALHFFQDLKRYYHQYHKVNLYVARCFIQLDRLSDAQKTLLQYVEHVSNDAEAYDELSTIAQLRQEWIEMATFSHKAVTNAPETPAYRFKLSTALFHLQNYIRAEQEADAAIKYHPAPQADYYHLRARIRWRLEKNREAISDWETAIQHDPKNAHYYAGIAETYAKLNDKSTSEKYYQKAIELEPDNEYYQKRIISIRQLH